MPYDQYMTGQEIAAEADYQAMLDADAEATAEAAYRHEQDEPICVCAVCGLITPLCDCQLAIERRVNARHPWPADPASLTEAEAATLTAARFDFRRREREARAI